MALIFGVGGVQRGRSGYDPVFGEPDDGLRHGGRAFRSAIDDADVKAILFRVDSPGRLVRRLGRDLARDRPRRARPASR